MKTIVFLFCFLFFSYSYAFAVSVAITQYPSTITLDPFTLSASISGATNGTNYLRIDMYKDGTQNYFGTTFNGTDWYGDSNYQSYLPITIASSKWSGTVMGSMGSPTASQYDGTGIYRIRIRRYTSGGTYTASEADASSVVVSIVTPTPTPTPTNVPTPTPFPTPTFTPTNTPIPTPTPTIKNISPTQLILSPTISLIDTISSDSSTESILGAETSITPTPTQKTLVAGASFDVFPFVSIGAGILILFACGILIYRNRVSTPNE